MVAKSLIFRPSGLHREPLSSADLASGLLEQLSTFFKTVYCQKLPKRQQRSAKCLEYYNQATLQEVLPLVDERLYHCVNRRTLNTFIRSAKDPTLYTLMILPHLKLSDFLAFCLASETHPDFFCGIATDQEGLEKWAAPNKKKVFLARIATQLQVLEQTLLTIHGHLEGLSFPDLTKQIEVYVEVDTKEYRFQSFYQFLSLAGLSFSDLLPVPTLTLEQNEERKASFLDYLEEQYPRPMPVPEPISEPIPEPIPEPAAPVLVSEKNTPSTPSTPTVKKDISTMTTANALTKPTVGDMNRLIFCLEQITSNSKDVVEVSLVPTFSDELKPVFKRLCGQKQLVQKLTPKEQLYWTPELLNALQWVLLPHTTTLSAISDGIPDDAALRNMAYPMALAFATSALAKLK